MSRSRYANGSARRSLVARVRAAGSPCWICGMPIDYSLPGGHPLSYELDELVPVSKGGSPIDPRNVAPAHRCCNQWRSDRSVPAVERIRAEVLQRFGRWASPLAFCEGARACKGIRHATPMRRPKKRSGAL